MSDFFEKADVIHSYSRKNMIDDGFLIKVPSDLAHEAGFTVPIGILLEVWESCIAWTDEDSKHQVSQDETGRLWDLLNVLRVKAKTCSGDTVRFTLTRVPRDGKSELPQDITLKAVIGPGDDLKPVITVMLLDQD